MKQCHAPQSVQLAHIAGSYIRGTTTLGWATAAAAGVGYNIVLQAIVLDQYTRMEKKKTNKILLISKVRTSKD